MSHSLMRNTVLLLAGAGFLPGQQPLFRPDTRLVVCCTTVLDGQNRPVHGANEPQ